MLLMLTCNESTILNKLLTFLEVVLISKMANINRYNLHKQKKLFDVLNKFQRCKAILKPKSWRTFAIIISSILQIRLRHN